MSDSQKLHQLQELAIGFKLLYVEDNTGLREQAAKLFGKFFDTLYVAGDGEEGLELFKTHRPKIVITDIKMPKLDGLAMAGEIHKIDPQTKVIVTTAYDDTDYLMDSIKIGVFRYLKKPIGIETIIDVLLETIETIRHEEEERLFNFYVKNIFNHQKNLLLLFHNGHPVIANNTFLAFFEVEDLQNYILQYGSLGEHFMPHNGFLYNHDDVEWYNEALRDTDHLHHVKMQDRQAQVHHFVFKIIPIAERPEYVLISLDDITELGLLKLFDAKASKQDTIVQDRSAIMRLLETAKRNSAEIKIHNLYKGLTITNKGILTAVNDDKIELRSSYLQQKGAQYEGQVLISNELFPADVLFEKIKSINFEQQSIIVDSPKFAPTSMTQRKSVRLEPDPEHTASLFYQEHKFGDGIEVVDISLEAVKLSLLSLPAGFQADEEVVIDMVFTVARKPLIINSPARVFEIHHEQRRFHVVLMLDPGETVKKKLIHYLSQRQMELIREFKGLQYAK